MFWRWHIILLLRITTLSCIYFLSIPLALATPEVLTIYCRDSFADTWGQELIQKFAPHVRIIKLSGTGLLSRLRLEGIASPADVLLGIDTMQITEITELGLTTPFDYDYATNNLPTSWPLIPLIPLAFDYLTILTHGKDDHISHLGDLLTYQDALIIPDPRTSTTGLEFLYWIQQIYGDQTAAYWQKLTAAIVTYPKGLSSSFALFASSPRFVTIGYSLSAQYARTKNNVDLISHKLAGAPLQVYGAVVTPRGAGHILTPRIIDYLRSKHLQQTILSKDYLYPAVKGYYNQGDNDSSMFADTLSSPPLLSTFEKADLVTHWLKVYQ